MEKESLEQGLPAGSCCWSMELQSRMQEKISMRWIVCNGSCEIANFNLFQGQVMNQGHGRRIKERTREISREYGSKVIKGALDKNKGQVFVVASHWIPVWVSITELCLSPKVQRGQARDLFQTERRVSIKPKFG